MFINDKYDKIYQCFLSIDKGTLMLLSNKASRIQIGAEFSNQIFVLIEH